MNTILNVLSFGFICLAFFYLGRAYECLVDTRKLLDSMGSK
jgi:hypothetical protein